MKIFKCLICGQEHTIQRHLILPEPSIFLVMAKEERARRINEFESRFFLLDKTTIYTKGNLFLRVNSIEELLHWQVWVSFSTESFLKMERGLKQSRSSLNASLASDLPHYKNAIGKEVQLIFNLNESARNGAQIIIGQDHSELSLDYWEGIKINKFHTWMHNLQSESTS